VVNGALLPKDLRQIERDAVSITDELQKSSVTEDLIRGAQIELGIRAHCDVYRSRVHGQSGERTPVRRQKRVEFGLPLGVAMIATRRQHLILRQPVLDKPEVAFSDQSSSRRGMRTLCVMSAQEKGQPSGEEGKRCSAALLQ